MKKFLALLLAVCLLTSFAPVLAEDATEGKVLENNGSTADLEVSLTIDDTLNTFKGIIPSKMTIDPRTKEGSFTISVEKDNLSLVTCQYLRVYLKDFASRAEHTNMTLVCGKNTASYRILEGTKPYYRNDNILLIDRDKQDTAVYSKELTVSVFQLPSVVGVYTDTITFGVQCTSQLTES